MSSISGWFPDLLEDTGYATFLSSGYLYHKCHTGLKSPASDLVPFRFKELTRPSVPSSRLGFETRPLTFRPTHAGQSDGPTHNRTR